MKGLTLPGMDVVFCVTRHVPLFTARHIGVLQISRGSIIKLSSLKKRCGSLNDDTIMVMFMVVMGW